MTAAFGRLRHWFAAERCAPIVHPARNNTIMSPPLIMQPEHVAELAAAAKGV